VAAVYNRAQIVAALTPLDVVAAVEAAFAAYSRGGAVVPPVGELLFDEPPGDCHIKFGYLKSNDTFTVKIATGFWENPARGLPSSNGVVLVFSRKTGELSSILQDEGWLTDIRTAAAGAVAARYLAPPEITCIGILGAGTQARLQLDYLRHVTTCRRVRLWARSIDRARAVQVQGFEIEAVSSIAEVASSCQLIVTTTPSREPLLYAHHLLAGTHVSAVGADGGGKQELSPDIFARAAIRAVDSRQQAALYGDASAALRQGLIRLEDLVELGQIIANPSAYQRKPEDITLVDLTGVAVQDIAVANLALAALNKDISDASDGRG
jgi:ornithine cyclodeaminase